MSPVKTSCIKVLTATYIHNCCLSSIVSLHAIPTVRARLISEGTSVNYTLWQVQYLYLLLTSTTCTSTSSWLPKGSRLMTSTKNSERCHMTVKLYQQIPYKIPLRIRVHMQDLQLSPPWWSRLHPIAPPKTTCHRSN